MSGFSRFSSSLIASPAGRIIARPWLDTCTLYLLKYWYFPLSRLWAAARAADGSVDKFIEQVPLEQPNKSQRRVIAKALHHFERARLKAFSIEQLWQYYFFGEQAVDKNRLPIVEEMRLDFRTAYNMTRKKFAPLRRLVKTSVSMNPPTPEDVAQRFGQHGEKLQCLFEAPVHFPNVEISRTIPTRHGKDYWLRFPSPNRQMNDLVYARVHEPSGIENPPTLIFGHGICVEFDHYHQILDEVAQLIQSGIRVIRPEAPWHGRRVLPGHYGGEQFLSKIPISMFDFIAAQHQEWATLINWCRKNGSETVAIGGSSLGAQSAKAIAMNANGWPDKLKPDALLVVTHSKHTAEAAKGGALSDIWNLGDSLRAVGWNQELENIWLQRLDPAQAPCLKGEHVVTVCGTEDKVTPMRTALAQMDAWQVPQENRFTYKRGHFSIPLGLINNNEALLKFATIINRINAENHRINNE